MRDSPSERIAVGSTPSAPHSRVAVVAVCFRSPDGRNVCFPLWLFGRVAMVRAKSTSGSSRAFSYAFYGATGARPIRKGGDMWHGRPNKSTFTRRRENEHKQHRGSACAPPQTRAEERRNGHKCGGWCGILHIALREDWEERGDAPDLTEDEVLEWADAFHARTGEWPNTRSGPIPEAPGETWLLIEAALFLGLRGFDRGRTLARFFAEHRGRYNPLDRSFSNEQILAWADAHHARTGEWPSVFSGRVEGGGGVTWLALDFALRKGKAGLPGGSSLIQLLAAERGVPMRKTDSSPITEEEILAWADLHYDRHGKWPTINAGDIPDAPGTNWRIVSHCLSDGGRGLPGGSSLPRFLKEHRGVPYGLGSDRLTVEGILGWLDAHYERTGKWPVALSGPVVDAPGETWFNLEQALVHGHRGLPGGSSIARLLAKERGRRNQMDLPDLTIPQILVWADAYHARTGNWPTRGSGPIPEAPGENWDKVAKTFQYGTRHPRLIDPAGVGQASWRRSSNRSTAVHDPPDSGVGTRHEARTGRWPNRRSGPIADAPGETWRMVTRASRKAGADLRVVCRSRSCGFGAWLAPPRANNHGKSDVSPGAEADTLGPFRLQPFTALGAWPLTPVRAPSPRGSTTTPWHGPEQSARTSPIAC